MCLCELAAGYRREVVGRGEEEGVGWWLGISCRGLSGVAACAKEFWAKETFFGLEPLLRQDQLGRCIRYHAAWV